MSVETLERAIVVISVIAVAYIGWRLFWVPLLKENIYELDR